MSDGFPIFIVHWNRAASCMRAITALRKQTVPVHITIVDNGSASRELENLQAALSRLDNHVSLITLPRNIGFGAAANVGLREWLSNGSGEWAIVAAHDAIPNPSCLTLLFAAVRDRPDAGTGSPESGLGHG